MISYKLYIESNAKQAISLKRLVMYDVEILWRFEHIIFSTDSILNTSNNSDICAHKSKLNIYLNIILNVTCSLYTAIWSTLIAPIPYNSIGKHFLTTNYMRLGLYYGNWPPLLHYYCNFNFLLCILIFCY